MSHRYVWALLLSFAVAAGAAETPPYYMWIDDEGVLNFSQVKPKNQEVEVISEGFDPEVARRPGHEMPAPGREQGGEEAPRAEKQPVPDYTMELPWEPGRVDGTPVDEVNARAREINCAIGRNMIASLNAHKNIFIKDEDGWWRKITEEQRRQKVRSAEKLIAENCGSNQARSNPS